MYTKEENLTNVEVVASGGCCGMAAPKVRTRTLRAKQRPAEGGGVGGWGGGGSSITRMRLGTP